MLINTPNLRALNTGFRTAFQQGFASLAAGASLDTYKYVTFDVPSTDKKETFGWMREMPGLRKWLGDRIIHSMSAGDYAITSEPYEQTVGVERLAILNDRYGVFMPRFQMMGNDARRHPNSIVWPAFAAALTAKGYDGVAFIGTTHPGKDANGADITWSNYQGSGGQPLWVLVDDSQLIKPIIRTVREDYRFVARENPEDDRVFMQDQFLYGTNGNFGIGYGLPHLVYGSKQTLDDTNLNAAIAAMMSVTLDHGKPAGVVPRKLFTGPANRAKALEAVKRQRLANGADNINFDVVEVVIIPEMLGA